MEIQVLATTLLENFAFSPSSKREDTDLPQARRDDDTDGGGQAGNLDGADCQGIEVNKYI
jgi:hypothetical protein